MDAKAYFEKQRQEAQEKLQATERGQALLEAYPDLSIHTNRWNTKRYSSVKANPKVTDCEIRHNCGCCSDSPIEIWPYLNDGPDPIYSNPACFQVGEANYGDGERPYDGWQQKLLAAQIPEAIIEKIQHWFEANKPSGECSGEETQDPDYGF